MGFNTKDNQRNNLGFSFTVLFKSTIETRNYYVLKLHRFEDFLFIGKDDVNSKNYKRL